MGIFEIVKLVKDMDDDEVGAIVYTIPEFIFILQLVEKDSTDKDDRSEIV